MRLFVFVLVALTIFSCGGRRQFSGPLPLQVRFDSNAASAELRWPYVHKREFSHYAIQRSNGGAYIDIGNIYTATDTVFEDSGLLADAVHQYRVLLHYGTSASQILTTTEVAGGIHRHSGSWQLADGFLPTRMVITLTRQVAIVGAGSGQVARFDGVGQPLESWVFTDEELACLETGTLDGPAIALDSGGNLYVVFNVLRVGQPPAAFWCKFDQQGRKIWTRPLTGLFARHIAIDASDRVFLESVSQLQQFTTDGAKVTENDIPPLMVASLRFWSDDFAALVEPLKGMGGRWQAPKLVVYDGLRRDVEERVIGREPLGEEDIGAGLLRRPTDFAIERSTGRTFVVNAGRSRIEVFQANRYLTHWGREGDGPGAFRFVGFATVLNELAASTISQRRVVAGGIALDLEGCVYVADTFNDRIQKFAR